MNSPDSNINDIDETCDDLDQEVVESLDENLVNLQNLSDFFVDRSFDVF